MTGRPVLLFFVGFLVGAVIGGVGCAVLMARVLSTDYPEYSLRSGLDVERLQADPERPVRCVMGAGSRFRVRLRKGDLNYVEFRTILSDRVLEGNAVAANGASAPPWDYVKSWAPQEERANATPTVVPRSP